MLCMSVNVRWNGRGWPGKVPRSPVASPEKAKGARKLNGKNGRPKGTVKSRMAKSGNGNLKKINKIKNVHQYNYEKCFILPYGLSDS
jgi:hypothetical protein